MPSIYVVGHLTRHTYPLGITLLNDFLASQSGTDHVTCILVLGVVMTMGVLDAGCLLMRRNNGLMRKTTSTGKS